MPKRKTLLDRVRAIESSVKRMQGLLPYMKDAIIVVKILMEKGFVTQEELKEEYDKLEKGSYGTPETQEA